MKTKNTNSSKVSGIIMMVSAIGIAILNTFIHKHPDSYIMPFIFFILGISFLLRKPSDKHRQPEIPARKRTMIIAALSVTLVAGIVILINTFFLRY